MTTTDSPFGAYVGPERHAAADNLDYRELVAVCQAAAREDAPHGRRRDRRFNRGTSSGRLALHAYKRAYERIVGGPLP